MKKHRIYVVEDDYGQAQLTIVALEDSFGDSIDIVHIATHHKFREKFEEIAANLPLCIILDVMLPWSDTAIAEEPPSIESFLTAGFQCCEQIRNDPRTTKIPILIYTVLDRSDIKGLPKNVDYLRKDSADQRLIDWVKGAFEKAPRV